MSFTSPTARPFSPRHRPPPIQVEQEETTKDKREPSVSFASSPAARASLLSNLRTRNENLGHPRTPYPPGFVATPKKQVYNESVYGVNHSSPSSSEEDIREPATSEERLDPRVYAALHAKQQELLATSQYIAQQQRIQLAMMSSAQQQLQLQYQYQQQQQQTQYYQDQGGNVWLMPQSGDSYAYSGVYGNYLVPSQQSSPRTGSPGSTANMYGSEYTGNQTQELYSMGNGSTASVNSSNGKAGKRKAHKKSSSLSSVQLAPHVQPGQAKKSGSPGPSSTTQFNEYRVEVGTRASSPSNDVIANGNGGNVFAPIRQPMIPITLEELGKSANSELNFWSVGIARLCTSKEGRTERGKLVANGSWEKTWVDEDLMKLLGIEDKGLTAVSDVEDGVDELSIGS
ncbi:hypothetical protein V1525DRAFT_98683 [Lipomyces kononenkoae]|uniref:Uncharacterized protein n=1 Tax=Lipomyces kononenkoae TaxID=34357 RepID=A0ACC3TBK0_LIPKO